jgi:hypothetical protein
MMIVSSFARFITVTKDNGEDDQVGNENRRESSSTAHEYLGHMLGQIHE